MDLLTDLEENNLLQETKTEEEDILVFDDEPVVEKPVKKVELKDKIPEIVRQRPKEPKQDIPEDEIGMQYDFTIPKQKLLDVDQYPHHERMIEPISQDIATSHLSSDSTNIVLDQYSLIVMILSFSNLTKNYLVELERFHVGKISTYANVSKGELGNLLKILRSNYTITEEKSEQKVQTNQKVFEETKQKSDMFGLGGR